MREPKEKIDTDLTKPVLPDDRPDDPCFGKLWDPQDNVCAVCHAIEICGILYQEKIKTKKRQFEEDNGPLLDQVDFERVPFQKIMDKVKSLHKKGADVYLDDLVATISPIAKVKDKVTVVEYITRNLPEYNMTIQDNLIVSHEKGIDNHKFDGHITR